jgi:hypothetical protein
MKRMLLKYETGVVTFVQFTLLSILNIINGIVGVIPDCRVNGGDCVWSTFATFIYVLLIIGWFAFLWVLGYTAQDRRSKRLAQILIAAEAFVALISFFNLKHGHGTLNRITSFTDLALALVVVLLAFRIMRANGGRVVVKNRIHSRKRVRKTPTQL